MKKRSFIVSLVSLVFVSVALLSCQVAATGEIGSMAPGFDLKDLDGKPFSLADAKGKVIILDFWATWCPPCRMEIPHFQALHREYSGRGLAVIGIALDRGGVSVVKPFAEANGVTYPVLIGNQKVTADYGGIRGIPTTFIINRQGKIVEKYVGYRDKAVFESRIKELL